MSVTVYTKPNCVQCDATKRTLDKLGVEYTTIDATADDAVYDMLIEKGFKAMPVVNAGDEWWSGFNPEKISELA